MPTALVVDPDLSARRSIQEVARERGFGMRAADDLRSARRILRTGPVDVAFVELDLPDGLGPSLLEDLARGGAASRVVFASANPEPSAVLHAFRAGAWELLTKPIERARLEEILPRRAGVQRRTADEAACSSGPYLVGRIVGVSDVMRRVADLIRSVAPTNATVFVLGDTGTGKELVAEAVHGLSPRADGPFVAVNCGSLSAELVESELFGHERGSFTGSVGMRRGVFERASGGTLFLDEITEMPLQLQVKLLRVLETRTLRRVGGDEEIAVDVRIVAATNRNPARAVRDRRLRDDLFHRLMVFPIELPPLRLHGEDIGPLARHFADQRATESGVLKSVTPTAIRRLEAHAWPGNVRELRHVLERAMILASDAVDASLVSFQNGWRAAPRSGIPVGLSLAAMEQRLILATLDQVGGNRAQAARVLGISRRTLFSRLKQYAG